MFTLTVSPMNAPDKPEVIEITFIQGDPVAINDINMSPANLLKELNRLGGRHGIGRADIVENRFVGMKSRGVYETPGVDYHGQRSNASSGLPYTQIF